MYECPRGLTRERRTGNLNRQFPLVGQNELETTVGVRARLVRQRERRLARDLVLQDKVLGWLDLRWNPEQIAHALRVEYPDNTAWHLVHESIYQAIYAGDGTLGRDRFTCRLSMAN